MIKNYRYKNIAWTDIENPTLEDVREVANKYKIDSLVSQELLLPLPKQKAERYPNFIYLTLQFPAWKHTHKDKIQEIDFLVGRDFIITARYDTVDSLHRFSKMFEVSEALEKRNTEIAHGGVLFYWMMRELYKSIHDELLSARDLLSDIEEKMFAGRERLMVAELSKLSRELLSFKHTLSVHEDILKSYKAIALSFFGAGYEYEVSLIQNEYSQIERLMQSYREAIFEIRDTNDSLLSNKQNEVIQTLTVIIFITSALAIFVGLFAIDAHSRPIIGLPNDFWILIGMVAIITIGLVIFFLKKEWI